MPNLRIHAEFKKGTVHYVPNPAYPLQKPRDIYFEQVDIYKMIKILVNILPLKSELIRPRSSYKIENAHLILNFSQLISKVCINYGSPCWT